MWLLYWLNFIICIYVNCSSDENNLSYSKIIRNNIHLKEAEESRQNVNQKKKKNTWLIHGVIVILTFNVILSNHFPMCFSLKFFINYILDFNCGNKVEKIAQAHFVTFTCHRKSIGPCLWMSWFNKNRNPTKTNVCSGSWKLFAKRFER